MSQCGWGKITVAIHLSAVFFPLQAIAREVFALAIICPESIVFPGNDERIVRYKDSVNGAASALSE
jgi:hypothetical protein